MKDLTGKFVIAYDTVVDGWCCCMDGTEGEPDYFPSLFDSEDEAFKEIFDSNTSILEAHKADGVLEEDNVTEEELCYMIVINKSGDADEMRRFMSRNPTCNYTGEWVEPADKFIMGRKAIWNGLGITIEGNKL